MHTLPTSVRRQFSRQLSRQLLRQLSLQLSIRQLPRQLSRFGSLWPTDGRVLISVTLHWLLSPLCTYCHWCIVVMLCDATHCPHHTAHLHGHWSPSLPSPIHHTLPQIHMCCIVALCSLSLIIGKFSLWMEIQNGFQFRLFYVALMGDIFLFREVNMSSECQYITKCHVKLKYDIYCL